MSEKMTVLNIRISLDEKNEIKDRAEKEGLSVSSYARNLLFSEDNTEDTQDNTVVIQEKDGRISDLKNQIDDYQVQAMMPTIQPIDELASEAGHQAIGQQLKDARKTFRSLLKNDKVNRPGFLGDLTF